MGCNTSTEQVLATNGNCTENLDNETNLSLQKKKTLDKNENQKISKPDDDLNVEDYGADEEEAALKIQSAFRGKKARKEVTKKRNTIINRKNFISVSEEVLNDAALKIQRFYRNYKSRDSINKQEYSTSNKSEEEFRNRAASIIQTAYRDYIARKELKEKEDSINRDESYSFSQSAIEAIKEAAVKIQAAFRGQKARNELKEKKNTMNNDNDNSDLIINNNDESAEELEKQAAVKIQAVFRGHKTRATMKNNSESSNTQSKASGNAATSPTEPEPTKEELEAEFDPNDKELCNAASKIQATFRGHLARKLQTSDGEMKEEDVDIQEITKKVAEELDIDLSDPDLHAAATKIQASFRGHKVRKTDVKE